MRHEDSSYRKKESSYKKYADNNSRKGTDSKKFAYNFQPVAFNPVYLPKVKTPGIGGLGYQPLPKPKQLVPGAAIYKYWSWIFIFYILLPNYYVSN